MSWYESYLKPVIEVATFMGVVAALFYQESIIKSQRKEFERQKEKDDKQAFDTLYFNLINIYDNKVKDAFLTYRTENSDALYREYLYQCACSEKIRYDDSVHLFHKIEYTVEEYDTPQDYINWVIKNPNYLIIDLNLSTALEILIKLDSIEIHKNKNLDKEYKKFYFNLFFSTKDKFELTVFLIWCLFPQYNKLKLLVEKYNLFEDALGTNFLISIKSLYNFKPLP
ncbi:hypothetical protein HMPREF9711_03132 [Myroides odoratimimus CCUG 3837]|uniref:putative phage abortive infection protein n=1 Tax=Myroides odoratimimus TaxID=76832 RepID=UPI000280ACE3|nr:putative phage abortive infection protein [Myroides odoratimimus]EKB02670.1 hypothetical protein HMPREF9711_03132 [Myroides odoratimimus CCUG 3837]